MPAKKRLYVSGGGTMGDDADVNIVPIVGTSALSLFTSRPIQVAVQGTDMFEYLSLNTLENAKDSDIIFEIPGNNEQWLDMSSLRVKIVFQVKHADMTELTPGEEVAPASVFGGSLFRNVECRIGDSVVSAYQNGLYSYQAYFYTVFRTSKDYKTNNDYSDFILLNAAGEFDAGSARNQGFKDRMTRAAASSKIHLLCPVLVPICMQSKLIPPGINVSLRFRMQNTRKSQLLTTIFLNFSYYYPGINVRKLVIVYKFMQSSYQRLREFYGSKCILMDMFDEAKLMETLEEGDKNDGVTLLLIDDFCHQIASSELLCRLFIGAANHLNLMIYVTCHNIYASPGANWKTCVRNTNLLILFPGGLDSSYMTVLNSRVFPGRRGVLQEAMEMAARDMRQDNNSPYHYLVVDAGHQTPRHLRLKSCIAPEQRHTCTWCSDYWSEY